MERPSPEEITTFVRALGSGDARAADRLVPHLYLELRDLAGRFIRGERKGHTLSPTALVNEAYLRLVQQEGLRWQDRAHFLAWAGKVMRQVLVDHARTQKARKRGGSRRRVPLRDTVVALEEQAIDLEALERALTKLESVGERRSRIVELRFFGGLTIPETAEVLGISHATVEREWRFARAWLFKEVCE